MLQQRVLNNSLSVIIVFADLPEGWKGTLRLVLMYHLLQKFPKPLLTAQNFSKYKVCEAATETFIFNPLTQKYNLGVMFSLFHIRTLSDEHLKCIIKKKRMTQRLQTQT